jgi:Amidase
MHPTDFTLAGATEALHEGLVSSVELTRAHLDAIAALNPRLNAYVAVTADAALAEAAASDARRKRGEARPLDGLPIANKDLFCTAGVATTAASRILAGFTPPYESTVTAQLRRDGAVFLGKLNCDEFAMGSANTTSAFGPVENPWRRGNDPDARLVPGGSSGGSAAAVAARLALAATATDTGDPPVSVAVAASRRPSAASLASSRPTDGAAASASWPSPPRSIRPGRWRGRWRIAPSCCAPWPGSIRRIRPARICRCRISAAPAAAA